MSDTSTKLRMSISRKNKQTGEYEQDFAGFVLCIGTAMAKKASQLNEGARIKIGDCDVSTRYDEQKKITYTNFKMFSFEDLDDDNDSAAKSTEPQPTVDEGEVESRLPF